MSNIRPLLICHSILNMTIPKQLEIANIFIIEQVYSVVSIIGHKLTPKLTISGLGLFVPARRVSCFCLQILLTPTTSENNIIS